MRQRYCPFAFLFFIWIIFGLYSFAQAQTITVSIQNRSESKGTTVDVPVSISGITVADSILSYQITLWYDSDVIQCVGATSAGTMTQNWGDPYVGPKTDTVRVAGLTTNQPTKRLIPDAGQLVKLQFLVVGDPGSSSLIKFVDMKLYNINGEMSIANKINGTLSVTTNPSTTDFDIILYPDWNLISFPLVPETSTMPEIFDGIPVIYVVAYYSGEGYKTWGASRPSWANSLLNLDGLHGYWIRLDSDEESTWTITGNPITVTTPIPLYSGWNLISYLPLYEDIISHSLASLGSLYSSVIMYIAESGGYRTWGRDRPSWANSLNSLAPQFGYWVRLDSARTLVYPSGGYSLPKSIFSQYDPSSQEQRDPSLGNFLGPPEYCEFWAYQPGVFLQGDRIQAYDTDGIMCGDTVAVINGGFIINVAGDDPDTENIDEGAVTGEEIRFTVNGDSTVVIGASANFDSVIVIGEKAVWQNMGSQRVRLELINSEVSNNQRSSVPTEMYLLQNYPNPFNSQTVISYQIPKKANASIYIFDATGRKVRALVQNRLHESGQYQIRWDGYNEQGEPVSSGVYIYQLQVDDIRLNKKMILLY